MDEVTRVVGEPLVGDSMASRLWRSIWRTHFYAGLFAAPILVMLALTGLVILYTEPIQRVTDGDLTTVTVEGDRVSLEEQRAAVADAHPEWTLASVTPPKVADGSTTFSMTDEGGSTVNVLVDPYSGEVLGSRTAGGGIVGLANRLHGHLNNDAVMVPVPTLGGVVGPGPLFEDAALGDVVIEIFAGWGLVIAFTGAYLWWPRKKGTGKAMFLPRLNKPGRARWRDLHAIGGTVLAVMLVFMLTTGLPWSAAWGSTWSYATAELTPNRQTSFWEWEGPSSSLPTTGDLDRAGNRIPWASGQDEVPQSGTGGAHHAESGQGASGGEEVAAGPPAAPVALDLVARAAEEEGLQAGYTIYPPSDVLDDPAGPVYGSYTVFNPWPSDMAHQGAIYVDQFSGQTLARSTPETWGRLQWLTEFGIQTHMGTQFGLFTRALMTAACALVVWNVFTAVIMWNNRRRGRSLGLPRRPADVRLQRILGITALVLAVVYPLWGTTLVVVLLVDRYVIRRVPRLRAAFGMR